MGLQQRMCTSDGHTLCCFPLCPVSSGHSTNGLPRSPHLGPGERQTLIRSQDILSRLHRGRTTERTKTVFSHLPHQLGDGLGQQAAASCSTC